jgi:hypothetical protein
LLRGIRRSVVAHHSFVRAVSGKIHRGEFAAAIRPQNAQPLARLCLSSRLELLDCLCCLILACQELQPHIPAMVIDKQDEVASSPMRRWCGWPAKVPMDQLERLAAQYLAVLGNGDLLCFPAKQLSQSSPACLMWGRPRTIFSNRLSALGVPDPN